MHYRLHIYVAAANTIIQIRINEAIKFRSFLVLHIIPRPFPIFVLMYWIWSAQVSIPLTITPRNFALQSRCICPLLIAKFSPIRGLSPWQSWLVFPLPVTNIMFLLNCMLCTSSSWSTPYWHLWLDQSITILTLRSATFVNIFSSSHKSSADFCLLGNNMKGYRRTWSSSEIIYTDMIFIC